MINRKSFLKALGVSPFVAKALLSDGSRAEASPVPTYQNICRNEGFACVWAGKCSDACNDFCAQEGHEICNRCQDRDCPGVCEVQDEACASGCNLTCIRACGRRAVPGECASCEVCR